MKGSHIRQAGEDVRRGDTVLRRGRRLGAADIGLASSVGRTLPLVHRQPTVAILSTGNELVEADEEVASGQVVNSNAYMLAAAVRETGAVPLMLPIARDVPEEVRAAFEAAARADAILSTGGVSVGDFDYVKKVMDEIGVRRLFWKVAQKPGKPLTFGMLAGRPHFGLPGNPVSALVCFYLYARPALRRMGGHTAIHLPTASATADARLEEVGRHHGVRALPAGANRRWMACDLHGHAELGRVELDVARRRTGDRSRRENVAACRRRRPGRADRSGRVERGGTILMLITPRRTQPVQRGGAVTIGIVSSLDASGPISTTQGVVAASSNVFSAGAITSPSPRGVEHAASSACPWRSRAIHPRTPAGSAQKSVMPSDFLESCVSRALAVGRWIAAVSAHPPSRRGAAE